MIGIMRGSRAEVKGSGSCTGARLGVNRELWDDHGSTVYIREEVPPTLFFFGEKLDGHWVSQLSRPVAPCRGWRVAGGVGSPHLRSFL